MAAAAIDRLALCEREAELAALRDALAAASAGRGAVVVVEGPAGIGKTELLRGARILAAGYGLRVVAARASELQVDFPFGIVRQLFEPVLAAGSGRERASLFEGAAGRAAALLGAGGLPAASGDEDLMAPVASRAFEVLHGLFWLTAAVARERPLLLAIDDLHWCDAPSLRFLDYLVSRCEELPVVVVVTARPGPAPAADAVARLLADPLTAVVRPRPLSKSAVAELVEAAANMRADPKFVGACVELTGGNPFLLRELLAAVDAAGIQPVEQAAGDVERLVAGTVSRPILGRLARLGPAAVELARALAVLGGEAEVRHAAALAGLDPAVAAAAADTLAAAQILRPERPLGFVHPLVLAAVEADLPAGERSARHRRAAELLAADGAPPPRVATHLLHVEARGDPELVQTLRAAAEDALAAGAPDGAVAMLRRAVAEPPPREHRAVVLLELGSAESSAGSPAALEHLRTAVEVAGDAPTRAQAAMVLGRTLVRSERVEDSAEAYAEAAGAVGDLDPQLGLMVEAAAVGAAQVDGASTTLTRARLPALREAAASGEVPRNVLAVLAFDDALAGRPATGSLALIEEALARAPLLPDVEDVPVFYHACAVLLWGESHGAAASHYAEALLEARRLGDAPRYGATACFASWLAERRGRLADAEAHARAAVDTLAPLDQRLFTPMAAGVLARALAERAEPEAAERELSALTLAPTGTTLQWAQLHHGRGRMRLAAGRPDDALEDLLACGALLDRLDALSPAVAEWRSDAALSLLQLGDAGEARRLAEDELRLARALGTPRAVGVALRAVAHTEKAGRAESRLHEAANMLRRAGDALGEARALTDLGGLLRRSGRRKQAREPLRRALDLTERAGALSAAQRAREELLATGARPRRSALSGVEALTPSERRVASLAAAGLTNREIAQRLFVTLRTVEWHLTAAYRKLKVSARGELEGALGERGEDGDNSAAP